MRKWLVYIFFLYCACQIKFRLTAQNELKKNISVLVPNDWFVYFVLQIFHILIEF